MIYLYVALSGGGIRAALLSAGACLALEELHEKQKVAVKNLHSISGSSLWIASLVSSKAGVDNRCRIEAERIAKNGFARSFSYLPAHVFIVSLTLASVYLTAKIFAPDLFYEHAVLQFFLLLSGYIFGLFLVNVRRLSLDLGREQTTFYTRLETLKSFGHKKGNKKMIPEILEFMSAKVAFGATEANGLTHESLAIESDEEIELGAYAVASAAFPGAVGNAKVGGKLYLDGGITGNLGITPLVEQISESGVEENMDVLIVDAFVQPKSFSRKSYWSEKKFSSYLAMLVLDCTLLGAYVYLFPDTFGWIVTVLLICFVLLLLSAAWILGRNPYVAIRNIFDLESRALPASLRHSRWESLEWLKSYKRKIKYYHVSLNEFEIDSGNLKTKLSPLHRSVSKKLIEYGYQETYTKLGFEPDATTLQWIQGLPEPWWANTKIMRYSKWFEVLAALGIFLAISGLGAALGLVD